VKSIFDRAYVPTVQVKTTREQRRPNRKNDVTKAELAKGVRVGEGRIGPPPPPTRCSPNRRAIRTIHKCGTVHCLELHPTLTNEPRTTRTFALSVRISDRLTEADSQSVGIRRTR